MGFRYEAFNPYRRRLGVLSSLIQAFLLTLIYAAVGLTSNALMRIGVIYLPLAVLSFYLDAIYAQIPLVRAIRPYTFKVTLAWSPLFALSKMFSDSLYYSWTGEIPLNAYLEMVPYQLPGLLFLGAFYGMCFYITYVYLYKLYAYFEAKRAERRREILLRYYGRKTAKAKKNPKHEGKHQR